MNYYDEIKNKLIDNEIYARVKDYSKERNKVITYYEVGKMLSEAGKEYGKDIIGEYSKKLVLEVGKKYNINTLYKMRRFYEVFSNPKLATLWPKLTWSHYRLLLPIKDTNKILYYINISVKSNLTERQLKERIKNNEYERLPEETRNKLIVKEETNISDFIKEPILIKNSTNREIVSEKNATKTNIRRYTKFF